MAIIYAILSVMLVSAVSLVGIIALSFREEILRRTIFLDGVVIAVSYMASVELGVATTLAIILHEIPQEIGDFGILIHAGLAKMKALLFNFLSALCAIVGMFPQSHTE